MQPVDFGFSQLRSSIENPRRALLELNKLYQTKIRGNTGINVVSQDWDNLVILDACRYDLFKKMNTIDGELNSVISKGSHTGQFMKENFGNSKFPEVVYLSANPNISVIDARFCDRIRLWNEYWNEDLRTVPPQKVTSAAKDVCDKYPNKRLIIHFLQPHIPFIGEFGQQLYSEGIISHRGNSDGFWNQMRDSSIQEEMIQAYKENIQVVLREVERLLDILNGRTAITSDHGNSFGTFGIYGHPFGIYLKHLVKVPWLIIDDGHRKDIVEGKATVGSKESNDKLDKKLEALGYN